MGALPASIQIMIWAWVFVIVWIAIVIAMNRKSHPKALFVLFFAELWERFSFYGMRSLLTLFMIKSLLWQDKHAYAIYGAYGALVYATPLLGGYLADQLLGYRKAILIGGTLMALGHFTMGLLPLVHQDGAPATLATTNIFFLALALLILGNGFFKPNISSFVGEIYADKIEKKDSAFTLFYMGINIGAFLAPLTCGTIGEIYGWHYGFSLAGIGMVIGLLVFINGLRKGNIFQNFGKSPNPQLLKTIYYGIPVEIWIIIGIIVLLPLTILLIYGHNLLEYAIPSLGVAMLIILIVLSFKQDTIEARQRLWVVIVLSFFSAFFWALFEQAGSSITLFTDRNVDRTVAGTEIKTTALLSVNPLFIILLAPLFSQLWRWLKKVNLEPSAPVKFSLGILQLGLGFFAFVLGCHVAGADSLAPLWALILGYFLHTTGELCLSPIGLSLVTKLSPQRVVGFVMGVWFLSSSLAHNIGALIAKTTAIDKPVAQLQPQETLPIYQHFFEQLGWWAVGFAILLFLLAPILKRWMHGVE